jgi:hypothetical protein
VQEGAGERGWAGVQEGAGERGWAGVQEGAGERGLAGLNVLGTGVEKREVTFAVGEVVQLMTLASCGRNLAKACRDKLFY